MILSNIGDFVTIHNSEPYLGISKVVDFNVIINSQDPETVLQEFRWSVDNKTYSSWIKLEPNTLRNLDFNNIDRTWFQFRITNTDGKHLEIDVNSFNLVYDIIPYNKFQDAVPPQLLCIESGNWSGLSRIPDLCFNPYNVNPAICLYQELSYHVNQMFGHEVDYFRAVADERGKDIIIKEYTIYDVMDPVCIKVLVPDNEFPDSQQQYNPFGMSFEQPFEVEIDKFMWSTFFPDGTGPQKRDVIYFALTNRFYEVLSSYMVRGFMEKETHWKVSLIKYSPKANRKEPQSLKDAVNALTSSMEKEFGKERAEEEIKETKPQQYTPDPTDARKDPIRNFLNKSIQITHNPIRNYGTIISEQHYDLRNLAASQHVKAVGYIPNVNIKNDLSYSAWVSEEVPLVFTPIDKVESMGASNTTMILTIGKPRSYMVGDLLKIFKGTSLVLYGKITSIIATNKYMLNIDSEILQDLNQKNPMWSGLTGWSCEKIIPTNLINGYDENTNTGVKIDFIAGKFISIKLNENTYISILSDSVAKEKWYGIFINISKTFKQIEVNVWERKWVEDVLSSPSTTDLFNIYNIIKNDIQIPNITIESSYELLAGNCKITNIRLFDNIAEIEKQPRILNQNIVKNAERAIIIDNAMPRYYLPHITN